jgi:hypothetical protein
MTITLADTTTPADVALPDRWWMDSTLVRGFVGYRRHCTYCDQPRRPDLHAESRFLSWFRTPVLYQTCSVCGHQWADGAITPSMWFDAGGTIHLRLRGDHWWVYDQVTLESLRTCPDVRGAFDLVWQRMERAGRAIEARGGHC